MAKPRPTQTKRQREQDKRLKRERKAERRAQRALEKQQPEHADTAEETPLAVDHQN